MEQFASCSLDQSKLHRVVTIGGDHTISLPLLRAVNRHHGPVSLVHFDAHLDTWDTYFGQPYTHGTPFRRAFEEGLFIPNTSVHVGTRGPIYSSTDIQEVFSLSFCLSISLPLALSLSLFLSLSVCLSLSSNMSRQKDKSFGFHIISADALERDGVKEVVKQIEDRVGESPVYVSIDIDVLFDSGCSFRPGARFGPRAVRSASCLLRPYNPSMDCSPFKEIQVADGGDGRAIQVFFSTPRL